MSCELSLWRTAEAFWGFVYPPVTVLIFIRIGFLAARLDLRQAYGATLIAEGLALSANAFRICIALHVLDVIDDRVTIIVYVIALVSIFGPRGLGTLDSTIDATSNARFTPRDWILVGAGRTSRLRIFVNRSITIIVVTVTALDYGSIHLLAIDDPRDTLRQPLRTYAV
ncbi:MAG: hypothetical protein VX568_03100 [Actinomycetota bacterium]|nr:hypothetical protein [Actinomycetota bacterium]